MLRIGAKLKIPDSNKNHGYVSRYVSEQTKKEILKSVGVENANVKAAIEYSRSHIVLPKGSKSADSEKESNVIHIKTTTTDQSVAGRSKNEPEKHQTTSEGKAKNVSVDKNFEPVVDFSKDIPLSLKNLVTNHSLDIMKGIMKSAGVHKIMITSTLRTAEKQVDAMYMNMKNKGIQSQLDYYAAAGREVVQAAIAVGGIDKSKENQVKKATG
ncbi:putative 17kDa proline rich protein [Nosema bombycis CQ1]|uniref:Putative 17kDa proline rich protein n=1 Tax=Nosema bombycis (strain CQ1 / CVCC 102059) TaxID=578461 RepID=R0M4U9_NOSB1|nr:putative 17kDa proline rich protein [Nosema bombycis CQ1]|eukprot:EOB13019.1 putative 17kDa proline rich protein [Nosema bombycis CQ1]